MKSARSAISRGILWHQYTLVCICIHPGFLLAYSHFSPAPGFFFTFCSRQPSLLVWGSTIQPLCCSRGPHKSTSTSTVLGLTSSTSWSGSVVLSPWCVLWSFSQVGYTGCRPVVVLVQRNLNKFVIRSSDPQPFAVRALVTHQLCHQFHLIYAFLLLNILLQPFLRIRSESILVTVVAPNWARRAWYLDLMQLLDSPWAHSYFTDLLSQDLVYLLLGSCLWWPCSALHFTR